MSRTVSTLLAAFLGACSLAAPGDEELVGSCDDGIKNGGESDVDCGGTAASDCGPCGVGRACREKTDCISGACDGTVCGEGNCSDGIRNGSESDIDCGGDCPALCEEGKRCKSELDCEFWCETTVDPPVCTGETCGDGMKNGGETDLDCGGPYCFEYCDAGQACDIDDDCDSVICTDSVCETSCDNGMLDGDETDIDCGGYDMTCPRCQMGQDCAEDLDCEPGAICSQTNFVCQ